MSNWISIKGKLPEKGQLVVCYIPDNTFFKYAVDRVSSDFEEFEYGNRALTGTENNEIIFHTNKQFFYGLEIATHWMPLSKPPKDNE